MVVPCCEVAMSDAEKESEARCKAMLNKLISMVKEQTVEMEALAVRLKATVQPLGPPVHALPLPVPAPTATLVTAVDHAVAAAAPHAEAALIPVSPTECSTSGPDTNAGDIQVVAESEPEKGVPTVAPALTEHSSAPSPKLFSTIKQDTVTPTRCSTACRSCNTDVAITSHAPSIGADVYHAEAEATPCTDSICATVMLANCSTPRRLYEQGGLKAWFRELPGGMLDSLPTEEVMQRPSEDDCTQLCTKLDDEMPRKWFDYYQGGVPWMPPWPPPQGPETLLELFHKQAGIRSTMRLVKHPNVLQLFEVRASKSKIYFVLEYAKGGVLFNKIAKGGKLSEDAARRYFHQLISAVDYCHSRGVYHRDLKPENLLLDENENLKVSDFGLSALAESKSQDGLLHTTCGTPVYVAPEVPSRKGYDGAKADIWSCGVTLFVLVAGYLPFHDTNLMEMYRKISKADFRCPRYFSAELKELLHKILDSDPSTKISVSRIKRRPVEVNTKKNETETTGNTCSGEATTSGSTECSTSEGNQGTLSLPNLNAFDIIFCGTPQASLLKVYINGKLTNRHALTLVDENLRDSHSEEQHSKKVPSFEISDNLDVQGNGLVSRSLSIKQEPLSIPQFRISEWDDRERWVWSPLYESRLAYRQELQFTVGPGGNVLCVSLLNTGKDAALLQQQLSLEKVTDLKSQVSNTQLELEKTKQKLHMLEQELAQKSGMVDFLQLSLQHEGKKRVQAETALISAENLYSQSQEEVNRLALESEMLNRKLNELENLSSELNNAILLVNSEKDTTILQNKQSLVRTSDLESKLSEVHAELENAEQKVQMLDKELKCMARLHVHFSSGLPSDGEVISGVRRSVNILIYLNVSKALQDEMKLYISHNKVISSFDGVVPVKYFEKNYPCTHKSINRVDGFNCTCLMGMTRLVTILLYRLEGKSKFKEGGMLRTSLLDWACSGP